MSRTPSGALSGVREELLTQFRRERIEAPTSGRMTRMVRSALRTAEQTWTARITERLDEPTLARLLALITVDEDGGEGDDSLVDGEAESESNSVLGLIKSEPGNVSLESMMTEIAKLEAVRAIGLPSDLFADVAPRVVAGWRARAAVEAPSHLRRHSTPLMVTLLAALVHRRELEITDTLVELLIATVHRIGARAEKRVTNELINAFKKVTGKENILFHIADAALQRPDDAVREVVFPAVTGGEETLRELVHEFKTKGPVYRRTVQTTLRASYTGHYRRGLIALLDILEFRSNNTTHRPVIDALVLIRRYAAAGNLTYYPLGDQVPTHGGTAGDGAVDLPHGHPRPRPGDPDGVRGRHLPGTARAAAVQGDLGRRRTPGATPTKICRPTSSSAANRTTGSCANRWTRPCSSTSCAPRWPPPWPSWMPRCPGWSGWTSPTVPPDRSA
ncbi:MAG: hypothetical protein L0H79_02090 [Intrasporangium sp.]|uniref:hypothetical protein n=1 Tax=Intrasporangium sp. TaxID=1925024 RepID=UPI00264904FE|nr:hypothetical protein [Intrasporangium sp.]MDN5794524.1 hypothetical protein [Intrasporangium sp.]